METRFCFWSELSHSVIVCSVGGRISHREAAASALKRVIVLSVAVVCMFAMPADAMDRCTARFRPTDGIIRVFAYGVSGALRWQSTDTLLSEFANPDCLDKGTARRCELGAPGTIARVTPPSDCKIVLVDDSAACTAHVRFCVPGQRVSVPCLKVLNDGSDVVFSGCNVHVRDGTGTTGGDPNGTGNLFVGYNELLYADPAARGGSHNLVVGPGHEYPDVGGFVAGKSNVLGASYATVSGGSENEAGGTYASVSGGFENQALGFGAAVAGGRRNMAGGDYAAVLGGFYNLASGRYSIVAGGLGGAATGKHGSVSGGFGNQALGQSASISGGGANYATGYGSSVTGGSYNTASGYNATVSGGEYNTASGALSSVAGGEMNMAIGR